jgi:hypothetical protein
VGFFALRARLHPADEGLRMQRRALLLLLLLAVLAAPVAAHADAVAIADDAALPWASGAATSPLEALGSRIASTISGRAVAVRCEGDYDWGVLAGQHGFDPAAELGYVPFWLRLSNGVQVGAAEADTFAELSPSVCRSLNTYALAPAKPTKCAAAPAVPQPTTSVVRERVTTTKRVKVRVDGHTAYRTKTVTTWRHKTVTSTAYAQTPAAPAPCYLGENHSPTPQKASYWADYFQYALSMLALAHESVHLGNDTSEVHANCYGLQQTRYVAEQLGASPDDAAAVARYEAEVVYPRYQSVPGYWSAECVDGGPLDLRPADPVWP